MWIIFLKQTVSLINLNYTVKFTWPNSGMECMNCFNLLIKLENRTKGSILRQIIYFLV